MSLEGLTKSKSYKKGQTLPPKKRGIVKDVVHPRDYNRLNFTYACEHCSFFISHNETCNMGHKTDLHLKRNQDRLYELTGRMAICRNIEID